MARCSSSLGDRRAADRAAAELARHQQLDSLREYVLVAQDRRRVEVWTRHQAGWTHAIYQAGSEAPLPSIDYALNVDVLYDAAGVC